MKQCKNF